MIIIYYSMPRYLLRFFGFVEIIRRGQEFCDKSHQFQVISGIGPPHLTLAIAGSLTRGQGTLGVLLLEVLQEPEDPEAHLYHVPRVAGHQLTLGCFLKRSSENGFQR